MKQQCKYTTRCSKHTKKANNCKLVLLLSLDKAIYPWWCSSWNTAPTRPWSMARAAAVSTWPPSLDTRPSWPILSPRDRWAEPHLVASYTHCTTSAHQRRELFATSHPHLTFLCCRMWTWWTRTAWLPWCGRHTGHTGVYVCVCLTDWLCLHAELSQTKLIITVTLSTFTCRWEMWIIERDASDFSTLEGDSSHYRRLFSG